MTNVERAATHPVTPVVLGPYRPGFDLVFTAGVVVVVTVVSVLSRDPFVPIGFAAGALIALAILIRNGRSTTLGPTGISIRRGELPWASITEVEELEFLGMRSVRVKLSDEGGRLRTVKLPAPGNAAKLLGPLGRRGQEHFDRQAAVIRRWTAVHAPTATRSRRRFGSAALGFAYWTFIAAVVVLEIVTYR